MTVTIEKFVEENISALSEKLGYNECWLYSFSWITDFEKFMNMLFKSNKNLFVVLPLSRDDKDNLADNIKKIARNNNASAIVIFSERLMSNNFIVCNKYVKYATNILTQIKSASNSQ